MARRRVRDRVRVLAAQVDVPLGGADGERRDRHALDQRERVALDQHAVGEGAAVALVGVAADELHVGWCRAHRLPLDAGREARAATTAQPGCRHLGDDLLGRQREGALETDQPAVVAVGGEVGRLDDPDPGEGDAVLPGQPLVLVDDADAALGVVERAVEQAARPRPPVMLPYPTRPRSVSTSTSGSSHSIPREPLRRTVTPAAAMASATASAPRATAAASHGTQAVVTVATRR